jgi:hypothetical protein
MRTGNRANVESSTQRPIHHRILLYLVARADCLCMSLSASLFSAFHSQYPDASSLLQPPSRTWLHNNLQPRKPKPKKSQPTKHSTPLSRAPTPTTILSNPHSPKTPTHSHDKVSETPFSLSLSLSLSLSPFLSRSPTPAVKLRSRKDNPVRALSPSSYSRTRAQRFLCTVLAAETKLWYNWPEITESASVTNHVSLIEISSALITSP